MLPFREGLQSALALALMLCAAAAPLVIGVCFGGLPNYVSQMPSTVKRFTPSTGGRGVAVPAGVKGTWGPACVKLNVTAVRARLGTYFNFLGVALFLISCLYASAVMGQPVEYRYFFFEVLLAGGRLKAFALRYCAVLAGSLLITLTSTVTASVAPYLSHAYGTLAEAMVACGGFAVLTVLAGASLGVLMSLLIRSVSNAFLACLGFVAVAAATSSLGGGGLSAFVIPSFALQGGRDPLVYVALITVTNALSLWRVAGIEY